MFEESRSVLKGEGGIYICQGCVVDYVLFPFAYLIILCTLGRSCFSVLSVAPSFLPFTSFSFFLLHGFPVPSLLSVRHRFFAQRSTGSGLLVSLQYYGARHLVGAANNHNPTPSAQRLQHHHNTLRISLE